MTEGPLDPTLQEIEDERTKAKAKADADAKAKAAEDAKKKASYDAKTKAAKWAQDWYFKLNQSTVNIPGSKTPVTAAAAISNISWAYKNLTNKSVTDPGQRKQLEETFLANKKAFQTLSTQFEKKYNKSIFDVVNNFNKYYKPGTGTPIGVNPILPKDLEILNVVLKKDTGIKLLPPETPNQTPAGPGGQGASNPVLGPGKIIQTTDSQGNPVYRWSGNPSSAIDISFVGDKNGNYVSFNVDPDYDRAIFGKDAGIDPNSPMSLEGYTQKYINDLASQPGAVDKLKNLLITKHIIPPSTTKYALQQQGVIDGYTSDALKWAINAVTAHNVALFNLGKPNQKYMTLEDYLNNMNPLSVSTTHIETVHRQIQPKDYEINIDNMFQSVFGRGATDAELKHFTQQLQAYSNAHPETTKTTNTQNTLGTPSKPGYDITQTQSGGISPAAEQAMMRDEALKNPEAEGYTKGAKFFNWFQQVINTPTQLGG